VRIKFDEKERERLWKMVGMNDLVWGEFAEFMDVAFQILM
jgi:hypothetical protein